jgi:DNA repair protein RAD57
LPTTRLAALAATHPRLASLPEPSRPSLSRVHAIRAPDLEAQEHIVRYQLPEAARRCGAGLIVVDSVAAHFRAEMLPDERERERGGGGEHQQQRGRNGAAAAMAERRARLVGLGAQLRRLARDAGAAVVVSNQVADRIGLESLPPSSSAPASAQASTAGGPTQQHGAGDPLALDHQQRWFTGWGDVPPPPGTGEKTPALGLAWANQIAGRVALAAESPDEVGAGAGAYRRRWMRVVFAKWAPQTAGRGVEFRVTADGVEGVGGGGEAAGGEGAEEG